MTRIHPSCDFWCDASHHAQVEGLVSITRTELGVVQPRMPKYPAFCPNKFVIVAGT